VNEAPFDAWVAHWLQDEPEMRLARVFAPVDARRDALFCIEREIAESVYGVRDTGVAQARLGWWMDECTQFAAQAARHPLTRELQSRASGETVALASALGRALGAALELVESESIATSEELALLHHAAFAPLVLARTGSGAAEPAVRAATTASLLRELRDWPRFAQPARARVPLQALARAGVDRALVVAGREAAITAQDALLEPLAAGLAADASRLDVLDAARVTVARRLLARRSGGLLGERTGSRLGMLLALWSQARNHRSGD